ncbi:RNA polymerase sigma-70 factor [Sphingobacterium tabacisoli]|uniref:RNA polymerase sigma-70 factor n=1 Tax=Sphingobacterium tabacisoli TaxID=2044855 RepID=A0ABW5KYU2_9SPHI|nr:RNA polymerase sigma-70 factor [Sphingobacterium tabacisoli]
MQGYLRLSDDELLRLVSEGDEAAFNVIYQRYMPLLYIYGCKIVPDTDEVKDILQEVFTSIWSKRNLRINTSFSAYIYTSVRYKLFDYIDKKKIRNGYAASLQQFMEEGECVTDNQILENELRKQIEQEINNLPPKMREVFVLSREANQSYEEIANQLDISHNTVRKQISNALKIIRSKFNMFFF